MFSRPPDSVRDGSGPRGGPDRAHDRYSWLEGACEDEACGPREWRVRAHKVAKSQKEARKSLGHLPLPRVYIGSGRKGARKTNGNGGKRPSVNKEWKVSQMTNTNNSQARHITNGKGNGARGRGRIVALALAGVLAIGGVGAVCAAGLGKAPTQAPAAAQTAAPAAAVKASTAKKAGAKKTETSAAKKVASKQAAQKVAAPTATSSPKQATQQAVAKQAEAPAATSNGSGLEAKISREECIKKACAHVGAGGQAKGEAKNVTAKQVTGGGTVYYVVELDLGDVHYTVNVDAIDGNVIGADSVHAGTRMLLDEQGVEIEGTATPAE